MTAYREGLDGLRERLREDVAALAPRVEALGPLRRVLLGDGDQVLDLADGLRADTSNLDAIDDGARIMELLHRVERVGRSLDEAIDASTRALAARPPLPEAIVNEPTWPGVSQYEIQLIGRRVWVREMVNGKNWSRKGFFGSLTATVPLRLPRFVVRSQYGFGALARYFSAPVVNHPAFVRHYKIEGDTNAAKTLLSRQACDALVRISLPEVRLTVDDGVMRLVCSHGARASFRAVGKLPTSAIQTITAILKVIEEA